MTLLAGAAIVGLAVFAIFRRADVRLVLILAAIALGVLAGQLPAVVRTLLKTLSDEKFVLPICTAMGFAYVLRQSGCDQHLVQLLVKPLRSLRPFLIPGTVLVGFLVNVPVVSQASTAVTVGPVLIPLLLAARLSPVTIGSALLLGVSIGGELLNPGSPELQTVSKALGIPAEACIDRLAPFLLLHLTVTTLLFWWLTVRAENKESGKPGLTSEPAASAREGVALADAAGSDVSPGHTDEAASPPVAAEPFRVNWLKAAVPLVPVVLLMLAGPRVGLLQVDRAWLVDDKESADLASGRLIGAAMLVGTVLAALVSPRTAGGSARSFFEGAGFAFSRIISVIVAARAFGQAVEGVGLAQQVQRLVRAAPGLLVPCGIVLPLLFALLCGSAFASTTSLFGIFAAPAQEMNLGLTLGGMVSMGAAAGRTMSPVAAVVLMCGSLTGAEPLALVRRVVLPLLAGLGAVLALQSVWPR